MNNEDQTIEELILKGGLEAAGVDQETGEILYSFTPKIQKLMPDLYKEHLNEVNAGIMDLWELGLVNIDLFSNDPQITLTEKALDKNIIEALSKSQRWNLLEIIRLLNSKG
jgi:hypothetical protein